MCCAVRGQAILTHHVEKKNPPFHAVNRKKTGRFYRVSVSSRITDLIFFT